MKVYGFSISIPSSLKLLFIVGCKFVFLFVGLLKFFKTFDICVGFGIVRAYFCCHLI
jgi:hypothetical protein